MTEAETYFIKLSNESPGITGGKMFGAICMKAPNGKAVAMFWQECLVVKLNGEALKEALSLDRVEPFEPMEGRLMKEWVKIPFDYKELWEGFVSSSLDVVKNLKKKNKS